MIRLKHLLNFLLNASSKQRTNSRRVRAKYTIYDPYGSYPKMCWGLFCMLINTIITRLKKLSPRSLDKMLLKRQVNVQSTQLSNFFKFSKSSKFSKILWIYDFQTCLKLFRFNMIWIVTIHKILKHVWTCSNMSKLVQIKYDTNCYNS